MLKTCFTTLKSSFCFVLLTTITLSASFLLAEETVAIKKQRSNSTNWPHWRGPTMDGVATTKNAPTVWSKTKNIAWKLPLPGPAGSTPAVWEKQIFLTSSNKKSVELLAISTSGKMLWRRTLTQENRTVRVDEGDMASPSVTTDGKFVCALTGNGHLSCYTLSGKLQWKISLEEKYGPIELPFGLTSTPILEHGRLYVQLIYGDGDPKTNEAKLICFNANNGEELWLHKRLSDASRECEHSYSSPSIYRDQKHQFLLVHGADCTTAHRLQDGQEIWRLDGLNPPGRYHPTLRFVASAVAHDGLVVVPTAKKMQVLGIRLDGTGVITNSKKFVLWNNPKITPDVSSPLIYKGLVYLCQEKGNLLCLDAKTGKQYYKKRLVRKRHRASPVVAGENIYLTARTGRVTVVKAGKKYLVVAENDLEEPITASPVFVNETLYLRTHQHLYAIKNSDTND